MASTPPKVRAVLACALLLVTLALSACRPSSELDPRTMRPEGAGGKLSPEQGEQVETEVDKLQRELDSLVVPEASDLDSIGTAPTAP